MLFQKTGDVDASEDALLAITLSPHQTDFSENTHAQLLDLLVGLARVLLIFVLNHRLKFLFFLNFLLVD